MNKKKYENVMNLNNDDRYDFFIRKVSDFEKIFIIYRNFWKIRIEKNNEIECITLFPEKEFAKIYTSTESSKKAKKRNLYSFLNWLKKDTDNLLNFAVFPNEKNEVKIVKSSKLRRDILQECKRYE